jgi:hypothetical protein
MKKEDKKKEDYTIDDYRYFFRRKTSPTKREAEDTAESYNEYGGILDSKTNKRFRVAIFPVGLKWRLCLAIDLAGMDPLKPDEVIPSAWREAANSLSRKKNLSSKIAAFKKQRGGYYCDRGNSKKYSSELVWRDVFRVYEEHFKPIVSGHYSAGDTLHDSYGRAHGFGAPAMPFPPPQDNREPDPEPVPEPEPKPEPKLKPKKKSKISDKTAKKMADSGDDGDRDIRWVYDHMGRSETQPADAPSPGAWSYLEWARDSKDKFFAQYNSYLKDKNRQQDDEVKKQKKEAKNNKELKERLEKLIKDSELEDKKKKSLV